MAQHLGLKTWHHQPALPIRAGLLSLGFPHSKVQAAEKSGHRYKEGAPVVWGDQRNETSLIRDL